MKKAGPGEESLFNEFADFGKGHSEGFFRGNELPKLLVLVAITVAGTILVWKYTQNLPAPAPEPEPAARVAPPMVQPDKAPEFETVSDKTPIGFRDFAAYDLLLKRARETTAAELAKQSHRGVYFTDLWERPEHYRGVPVHLLGNALRITSFESKRTPHGLLYEAWINTHESQGYPYYCLFEDLPPGLPLGPDVAERVVFNGYFLKQMRYLAGKDIQRAAPVLIGRIGWTRKPVAVHRDDRVKWMALVVAILFVISLYRWIAGLRRSLSPASRAEALSRRPSEELDPTDLAEWVESVRADESEDQETDRKP
jgi:hypothetical protein